MGLGLNHLFILVIPTLAENKQRLGKHVLLIAFMNPLMVFLDLSSPTGEEGEDKHFSFINFIY